MREILFRAKRIKDGKWIEGFYEIRHCVLDNIKHLIFWSTNASFWECAEIDPETLCQFTGLHDINGNKIWENDIVRKVDSNALGWHRERMCSISFDKLGYWLLTTEYGDGYWVGEFDSEQLEVISTVFDNPELLKGGI